MRSLPLRTVFLKQLDEDEHIGQLMHMIFQEDGNMVSLNTEVNLFTDGQEKFNALIADIEKAKRHVHIQYYIYRMDALGIRLKNALIDARKRGVEVRVLIDAWGSNGTREKDFADLIAVGGQVNFFFPLMVKGIFRWVSNRVNYRNHRKLAIIDGKIGYAGGFNVGIEYLGQVEKFGYWRDNHLRLTGDIVYTFQNRFIMDWNSQGVNQIDSAKDYFPDNHAQGKVTTQFVTSGPDTDEQTVKLAYMKMISSAKEEIIIQSPYYIPDDTIHESLKLALQSGVKVKLMIPNKPDHMLVYWGTYSHAANLIKYGAEVYTYEDGFVHAKTVIIDRKYASVGSANFDYRSFQLAFEGNVILYDPDLAMTLVRNFDKDVAKSQLLTQEIYDNRSFAIKFKEGLARLIAPIL